MSTKQLQDKITKLQSQKTKQQSQFLQKKQHYESIIQSLQGQNQKLRRYIQQNSQSLSLIGSQAKSTKSQKGDSPVRHFQHFKQVSDEDKEKAILQELTSENMLLKQQLSDLTTLYEEQIEQMTNYFNKIQEAYTSITKKATQNPKEGYINDLVNAYENLLKDFESQRTKYVEKIEQLTNYILQFEQKNKKTEEINSKMEIQLKIVKEELKIYKRSKIGK